MGDNSSSEKRSNCSRQSSTVKHLSRQPSTTVSAHLKPVGPLDGGWGWVIVFAAALGHFLLVGFARTLGVFFVDWVERFQGTAASTSWVQSLFNTVRMVVGPVVSILCDTYGSRTVVMIGGFVFGVGCIVSAFATSLVYLYFTFSVLAGMGAGLVFTPMFVMVNQYFEKKKGIAMALATIGSGLGTLVFAPLETFLLDEFGHYGTMLIFAGIMFNTILVGALFRPLGSKLNFPQAVRREEVSFRVVVGADEDDDAEAVLLPTPDSIKRSQKLKPGGATKPGEPSETITDAANSHAGVFKTDTVQNVCLDSKIDRIQYVDLKEKEDNAQTSTADTKNKVSPSPTSTDKKPLRRSVSQTSQGSGEKRVMKKSVSQASHMSDKYLLPTKGPSQASASRLDTQGLKRVPSCTSQTRAEVVVVPDEKSGKCAALKKKYAILKSLTFWVYCFYIAALPCAVQIYLIYTPSLMKERGFSEAQRALVISIAGASDIAGRIVSGFFFDLHFIRSRRWPTHCCCCIILSIVVFCNAFQHSLVGFISIALLWGIFEGTYHGQRATIVSEFISREQLASTVGFMIFWQGIGNMLSPTFAGYLTDVFGSYNVCFYYAGTCLFVCGIMFLCNYIVVRYQKIKSSKKRSGKHGT